MLREIGFHVSAGGGSSAEDIRAAIARYLRAHPSAADTATGIATCWLVAEGLEAASEALVAVLDSMVAQHELRAIALPGGDLLYESWRSGDDT